MSESLEILPNNTLYFMGLSRRVVGLCLAYFRLLKNKFQIWKQREPRPSWGATGGRIPHTQWLLPPRVYLQSLPFWAHFSHASPDNPTTGVCCLHVIQFLLILLHRSAQRIPVPPRLGAFRIPIS